MANNINEAYTKKVTDRRTILEYDGVEAIIGVNISYPSFKDEYLNDIIKDIDSEDLTRLGAALNISLFSKHSGGVLFQNKKRTLDEILGILKIKRGTIETKANVVTASKLAKCLIDEYRAFIKSSPESFALKCVSFTGNFPVELGVPNGFLIASPEYRDEFLKSLKEFESSWIGEINYKGRFSDQVKRYFENADDESYYFL